MSVSNPSRKQVMRLAAGLALGASVMLSSGCNIRPLYGDADLAGSGQSTAAALGQLAIDAPQDRVTQIVRNELVFAFTGAQEPANPRYRMALTVTRDVSNLNIETTTGNPLARRLILTASFEVVDSADGSIVIRDSAFAESSYDWTLQRFANNRAEKDAEDRAARVVADDIRTRVAAALASRDGN